MNDQTDPFLLRSWDHGIVTQELVRHSILPRAKEDVDENDDGSSKIGEGTFSGTSKALTDVYHRIESRYVCDLNAW